MSIQELSDAYLRKNSKMKCLIYPDDIVPLYSEYERGNYARFGKQRIQIRLAIASFYRLANDIPEDLVLSDKDKIHHDPTETIDQLGYRAIFVALLKHVLAQR